MRTSSGAPSTRDGLAFMPLLPDCALARRRPGASCPDGMRRSSATRAGVPHGVSNQTLGARLEPLHQVGWRTFTSTLRRRAPGSVRGSEHRYTVGSNHYGASPRKSWLWVDGVRQPLIRIASPICRPSAEDEQLNKLILAITVTIARYSRTAITRTIMSRSNE